MTYRHNTALGSACVAGLMLLVFAASVAYPQDEPGEAKQTDKKKAETRKVEVHVKVAAKDGRPIPSRSTVEISGREAPCGTLSSNDARETVDDKGEATFQNLPACKVTVKMNLNEFMPVRVLVDLTGSKSCAAAPPPTPAKEKGEPGPPQPACETVSLVLDPL
jgi:hypothetical protein